MEGKNVGSQNYEKKITKNHVAHKIKENLNHNLNIAFTFENFKFLDIRAQKRGCKI